MLTGRPFRFSILWITLGIGVLTHSAFLIADHSYYAIDTASYMVPADNLLHGHGFVNKFYQPEVVRTPGYPLMLALFQINPLRVEYLILLQHLLCVLTVAALAAVALRITNSSLIALASASVLSFDLATLVVANELLTEITFTVFIALISWILFRVAKEPTGIVARSAVAGLLGGCAVLIRPVGVLYFVPVSAYFYLVLKRRAFRPIVVFTALFLMIPLGWSARNYLESGYFGISTIGAQDLLDFKAAGALAARQPGDYFANVRNVQSILQKQACEGMERKYERDCSQLSEAQQAKYTTRMGANIILRNIPGYLKSALVGIGYMIFGGGTETLTRVGRLSPHLAGNIVLLVTVPEACLAVAGCFFWFRRERAVFYLIVLTVAYFLLISASADAYSRYRVPVMPMYALLVGGGIAAMIQLGHRIFATSRTQVVPSNYSTGLNEVNVRVEKIQNYRGNCS
jgi:4-amino-4-deoxy-L-arabinose transferase-like glycosyltransferase